MPTLTRSDDVFVLNLGDTENRFHPDWLAEVGGLLDDVLAATGPKALVTTATGKFFSNGLDLDWLGSNGDQFLPYVISVHHLFERVLALPVPTVAAIQGHAFAGGGMLSLAHDFRVMRADRGFFCLPEVDINIPFSRGHVRPDPGPAEQEDRARGDDDGQALRRQRRPGRGHRRRDRQRGRRALVGRSRSRHRSPPRPARRWARSRSGCTSRRWPRFGTSSPRWTDHSTSRVRRSGRTRRPPAGRLRAAPPRRPGDRRGCRTTAWTAAGTAPRRR